MKPGQLRAQAASILARLEQQQGSLATLLERPGDNTQDFPLLQEICFGTCRWHYLLDAVLCQLLEKPLKAKDQDIHCLLLCGLYQLHGMRVPEYAVVNETVAATLVLKKQWAKGLVNAVLRSFLRDRDALIARAMQEDTARFAHPDWFLKAMQTSWPLHWQAILDANNQHPPMTLRVNLSRITRQEYLARLATAQCPARPGTLSESSVYLEAAQPVTGLPGFAEGLFSVQDEASQLIPDLLDLQSGLSILDACAAPGGKTCHLLERGVAFSRLVALDNDARRLDRVQQNLDRLQLQATLVCADAGQPSAWWDGRPFDRILLDAPCSATGIIRRHPDIKLLRKVDQVLALQKEQLRLLHALWPCLKPDGLLLYSTCSVLPGENSNIIGRFLAEQGDAKLEEIPASWGVECVHGRQLLPDAAGHDGFYFARLRKNPEKSFK
jgi:16S rRNA (cytosine967-C5)-methyltransferase